MSIIGIDNELCSAVLYGKNFSIGNYTQTFQPIFFIPAMLLF